MSAVNPDFVKRVTIETDDGVTWVADMTALPRPQCTLDLTTDVDEDVSPDGWVKRFRVGRELVLDLTLNGRADRVMRYAGRVVTVSEPDDGR